MIEALKLLVVGRAASHWGRYERSGMTAVFMNALPEIREAHDWNTSATLRWTQWDLDQLNTLRPRRLAAWLVPDRKNGDADVETEAVIELVMHGQEAKAHDFMTEVIRRRPQARDSFTRKLGHQITQMVLASPSVR